jgi:hypothetical protein
MTEYALKLNVFALALVVTMQAIASTGNARLATDEPNYTNAFVVGN